MGLIMLFACIHVPDFPVQAALRVDSAVSFKADAVAVLEGPESLLKVFACNGAARRAGISPGMAKTQVEACPQVVLHKRVVEHEETAQSALLDCGYGFSPRVESTSPGTITIDLSGTERLLGAQTKIGEQLVRRAEACRLEVNVALAANPDAALHAARGFTGITVIAPGKEARRLACLPVEVLQPPAELLDALDSWGIRDFQSLAALPVIPLTQRLGQQGLHLQRLARGEVQRELVPAEPAAAFRESMELEEPVELLEPLAFVLNRLLEQVTARLAARSLATDHVHVELGLEAHVDRLLRAEPALAAPALKYQRTLKLPVPTQDAKVLLKLLQLDLAAHPPQAPVKKIAVEAFPARVRFGQAGLFQPLAPEPAKLEITMARLRATVGEKDQEGRARVGFPAVLDSHKPQSFQVLPLNAEREAAGKCITTTPKPRCVVRVFRPPLAATVELNCDVPVAIAFSGWKGKIKTASGPWRSNGAWWDKAEEWKHEEWDVELSITGGTGVYRIFRELPSERWFVEGMYD
ncbi:MAG TPA: DNA polymerase Y family protein [Candidatus Angelobacter sp.]